MTPLISSLNEYANWEGVGQRMRVAKFRIRRSVSQIAMLVCAASVVWAGCQDAFGQVSKGSSTPWLQGRQLIKNQAVPVSVSWTQSPIRKQLSQFAITRKHAIFLDRRIDPTTLLTLQFLNQTTEQVVWATAKAQGLGVVRVGDLLYVGPKQSAASLPWMIKRVLKSLPSKDRKFWNSKSEMQWSQATSTPQIAAWFESQGVKFPQSIPHDVWSSTDWPRLTRLEQLSLVLIGFDTSFEIAADGRTVIFIGAQAIEDQAIRVRMPRDSKVDPLLIAKKIPKLKARRSGKMVAITGDIFSLLEFEALMVEAQDADVVAEENQVFTMGAEGRRRDILAKIAKDTGRELMLDGNASASLDEKIKFELVGVTLKELLDACVEGSPLTYQVDKMSVKVSGK